MKPTDTLIATMDQLSAEVDALTVRLTILFWAVVALAIMMLCRGVPWATM